MNKAKLVGLNKDMEEEVVLNINGIEFTGFASVCKYPINLNKIYPVEVYLTFLDSEDFTEIDKEEYSLTRINNTYSYILRGRVCENGYLDVGHEVKFCSEGLFDESYIKGRFVEVTVDRLDVEFLPMDSTA